MAAGFTSSPLKSIVKSVSSTASIIATPLERHTIPRAEVIVAATMLTKHKPTTNMAAAAGPGQREDGNDQSGASWRNPVMGYTIVAARSAGSSLSGTTSKNIFEAMYVKAP